jgi:hypothetical protein
MISDALSAALSADGNTAIVGGRFDKNHVGAAWVFVIPGRRKLPSRNRAGDLDYHPGVSRLAAACAC